MSSEPEPIAIVGMACRLPGQVSNPQDLWNLVTAGGSGVCDIPLNRFNVAGFRCAERLLGSVTIRRGHYLDQDIWAFDNQFFGITEEDARSMDPQQRQLLEVAYECLESAGVRVEDLKGTRTGVFCSMFTCDYNHMLVRDADYLPMYYGLGVTRAMLANRISHAFDWRGPSAMVDSACSSSLTGLHLACQALRTGDCDAALVGAANLLITPEMGMGMDLIGSLAQDGVSRSFDANASGYGRGEGINAVFVKRLSDAILNGDPVRAIIRGTAVNNDGGTATLSMPSSSSHEDLIRLAYANAGIHNLAETAYFECHGTGTTVGDPIEVSAIGAVFSPSRGAEDPLWIGSTKPNIGHSEAACGLSSVIKVAQALEYGQIPPNINFQIPNPKIQFDAWRVRVPTKKIRWPSKPVRRASVNSFGIGGANAHVVLDAINAGQLLGASDPAAREVQRRPYLGIVSGSSPEALQRNLRQWIEFLEQGDINLEHLPQLLYVLNNRRSLLASCHVMVGYDMPAMIQSLACGAKESPRAGSGKKPEICFVFSGQGLQWSAMGLILMETFPRFCQTIQQLDAIMADLAGEEQWSLLDKLRAGESPGEIDQPEFAQPLCTAVQIALVDLLASWDIQPKMAVGHSSGEIAAAYAAQVLTAREAMAIAYYRGLVLVQAPLGAMLAVMGSHTGEELQQQISNNDLDIACFNSPNNITVAGNAQGIGRLQERLEQIGMVCKLLQVDRAYHSRSLDGIASTYAGLLAELVHPQPARIPLYSALWGRQVQGPELTPKYWEANLREPVRFYQAITKALEHDPCNIFVEVGPHRALSRAVAEIHSSLQRPPCLYLSTMIRHTDSALNLVHLAGDLVVAGVPVNLEAVNGEKPQPDIQHALLRKLPTYAWDHSRSWCSETRPSREWRFRQHPRHELLGSRLPGADPAAPTWRNILQAGDLSWAMDYQIHGVVTLPVSAMIAMVIEAMYQIIGHDRPQQWQSGVLSIHDLRHPHPLAIPGGESIEILLNLRPVVEGQELARPEYEFSVASIALDVRTTHALGAIASSIDRIGPVTDRTIGVSMEQMYQSWSRAGHRYGPSFRLLAQATAHPRRDRCSATVDASGKIPLSPRDSRYVVHPVILDAAIQTTLIAQSRGISLEHDGISLPSRMGEFRLRLSDANPSQLEVLTDTHANSTSPSRFDVDCFAAGSGNQVCWIRDLVMAHHPSPREGSDLARRDRDVPFLRQVWKPDAAHLFFSTLADSTLVPRSSVPLHQVELLERFISHLSRQAVAAQIRPGPNAPAHMAAFAGWLQHHAQRYPPFVLPDADVPEPDILSRLLSTELRDIAHFPDVQLALRLAAHMDVIFAGEQDALSVMLEDRLLNQLYETGLMAVSLNEQMQFMAEMMAHKNPNLRILEIGAGTGGTTLPLLRGFTAPNGQWMYQSYTFTDISVGFFEKAKAKFADWGDMLFQPLNIEMDPVEQGFTPQGYDLIVASNVLHATADMSRTMSHVRLLLRPGGHLLLGELAGDYSTPGYLMGALSGWWLRSQSPTCNGPGLSVEEWESVLTAAHFTPPLTVPSLQSDGTAWSPFSTVMIATAVEPAREPSPAIHQRIYLVSRKSASLGPKLAESLSSADEAKVVIPVDLASLSTLADDVRHEDCVVILDEGSDTLLLSMTERELRGLYQILDQHHRVVWATVPARNFPSNPSQGLVAGFARAMRSHPQPRRVVTVEMSSRRPETLGSVLSHVIKFYPVVVDPPQARDWEFLERDGQLYVGRLDQDPVLQSAYGAFRTQEIPHTKLLAEPYGLTSQQGNLTWVPRSLEDSNPGRTVVVEVKAVGLRLALGAVTSSSTGGYPGTTSLAQECVGILRECSSASGLQPGDRVLVVAEDAFQTIIRVPETCCKKIPDTISLEEAAALPIPLIAAWHGLVEIGRISSRDRVLVFDAASAVGIAAIQVACRAHADVYAVVATSDDCAFMMQRCGLAASRVIVLQDSGHLVCGDEFDIIFDPREGSPDPLVSGLAWHGHYLEVTTLPRDSASTREVTMVNSTFSTVDIAQLVATNPTRVGMILDTVLKLMENDELSVRAPSQAYPLSDLDTALDSTRLAVGSARPVVQLELDATGSLIKVPTRTISFDATSSYLLIGPVEGLGRAIATWMAQRGASHLLFLVPSPGATAETDGLYRDLAAYGCEASLFSGDMSRSDTISKCLAWAKYPIRGVIYLPIAASVTPLIHQAAHDFASKVTPTVQGCMNLHKAFHDNELRFLLLLGSISGSTAASAPTNAFLSSFVRFRQQLGQAARAVHLGPVEGLDQDAQQSAPSLTEQQLFHLLEAALQQPPVRDDPYAMNDLAQGLSLSAMQSPPSTDRLWAHDRRFARLLKSARSSDPNASPRHAGGASTQHASAARVRSLIRDPDSSQDAAALLPGLVQTALTEKLTSILSLSVEELDISQPATAYGMDSLVALEMRSWVRSEFLAELLPADFLGSNTIHDIAEKLCQRIMGDQS
ncbi:hypothetical protein P175DRAFT_0477898 [Aspergillus ochraceoroseus IBT 24754]|uniref:Uncharacterized protein n=1 Tax=Aspergillus ochraceoroseus IBT 24754 TaxID=1392256 RepID=A0A2T5M0J1_9EURO|nr:uncharacterized protein P175DRAFT_0477898 [Aspergillus ochraceoroseus IBT 24754]PTU22050.1 hypothetical protein P175DRAFT_0477898 [Aspergillus ochraceoroseus IBT 24754]